MTRVAALGLALAGALLVPACATVERYDAASDVRELLVAVRDGDRAAFDRHVDRPALTANLKARVLAATAGRYGVESREAALALLAGPLMDAAVDALVRPQVFKAAAELAGYGPETSIPGALVITREVKPLGPDRACAMIRGRCAFIFKREDGVWRLIDFEGDLSLLRR